MVVLDRLEIVPAPCNPDRVCADFAEVLKTYGLHAVGGDKYAAEWPVSRFRSPGIVYTPHERTTSEHYTALLPLFASDAIRLLDCGQLRRELLGLERRAGRSGKDAVSHRPGGHDDAAAAVAAACVQAAATAAAGWWVDDDPSVPFAVNVSVEEPGRAVNESEWNFLKRLAGPSGW